jgi:hypothetical protein
LRITLFQKILLTLAAFAVAIVGFIVKLPSVFSGHDKVLHTLFYFLAAAFLNALFAKRNIIIHAVIFGILHVFGVAVEYAQQYSNTYFHSRIHGNADPEDISANLQGLIYFSVLWLFIVAVSYVWNMFKQEDKLAETRQTKETPPNNSIY